MLSCRELTEQVDELLDERLPFWRRMSVRMHLAMCHRCRTFVRQYRRMLRLTPAIPEEATDDEVAQVLASVEVREKP